MCNSINFLERKRKIQISGVKTVQDASILPEIVQRPRKTK